ncbi:MAG: helix-turn-helix transcriptional regulator [Cryobacterium sp.]|nr:helix-turn-helix transcriptional regulator [Cryobacterium sp.]MCO5293279.1 TetR family transcriptional regulator [Homoserinimonas sp.]
MTTAVRIASTLASEDAVGNAEMARKATCATWMAEAGKYPGQELRKAKTRKKILDAANEIFDKNGYEKTSIEEIAREASVSSLLGGLASRTAVAFPRSPFEVSLREAA